LRRPSSKTIPAAFDLEPARVPAVAVGAFALGAFAIGERQMLQYI
jgi:hypothetical protein